MKIGILTFHCAHNYGAVLQCYALREYLSSQGHEVMVLDYRPDYLLDPYRIIPAMPGVGLSRIKWYVKFVIEALSGIRRKRYSKFIHFISRYLQPVRFDPYCGSYDYEIFVIGSDQVWNPGICNGLDDVYLGNFTAAQGKRLISYAASGSVNAYNESDFRRLQTSLANFQAVSVREAELRDLIGLPDIRHVLDPTFIVDRRIWESIAKLPVCRRKYVLIYQVQLHPATREIAEYLAGQLGAEIIEVCSDVNYFCLLDRSKRLAVSPEEFVGYFSNAEFIVTTSFHGTAFSVIFNRPFYTIRFNNSTDVRSQSFLSAIGLADRLISADLKPLCSALDFECPNRILADLKEVSRKFLIDNL